MAEEFESGPRYELAVACRALYASGCMKGIGGHVSVRAEGDTFWVNCLDKELSEVTPNDIVKCDGTLRLLVGDAPPSPGVYFHPEVYARRPDVHSIVHTHGPAVTRMCALKRAPRMVNVDSVFFSDCRVSNDPLVGITEGLGDGMDEIVPFHGAVSVAATLGLAVTRHSTLELACQIDLDLPADSPLMTVDEIERSQNIMLKSDFLEIQWALLRRKAVAELAAERVMIDA